ncbi:hypothetical protein TNCV_378041 [Trichonephila clavipes]|nr:hypothetical protein TNCV_378041 [Trichonephila clavipes]
MSSRNLPLCSASSCLCLFDYTQQEKPISVEPEISVLNTTKVRRVLFDDDSRFTKQNDSRPVFIWTEGGTRLHSSYVTEIDRFGGKGIFGAAYFQQARHYTSWIRILSIHNAIGMRLAFQISKSQFYSTRLGLGRAISQRSLPSRIPQKLKNAILEE